MTELQKWLINTMRDEGSYAPVTKNTKSAMTRLLNSGIVRYSSTGRYELSEYGKSFLVVAADGPAKEPTK